MLSYSSNCIQRVKVGSCRSNYGIIKSGNLKGSVHGPLLFHIFINDIFYMNLDCSIWNFAGDNTLYSCNQSLDIAIAKLENTLTSILTWYDENEMVANPAKISYDVSWGKGRYWFYLSLSGKMFQNGQTKLLGVAINGSLNFDSHIKEICSKVNQKNSAFARLREYISEEKGKLLVNTVVMPNFQCCPLIWLFYNRAANNEINRTTKRAMRIVCDD